MKDINIKKVLNITTYLALLAVPFIRIISLYLDKFNIISTYDSINPSTILYCIVPFLIFIYIYEIVKSKRKLDIYDYLLFALTLTGIISIIFSIDKYIAIFGKTFRHEGFLSVLSYYLLFINWKVNGNKEDVKKMLKLILIIGIVNSIYSLLQVYTDFNFIIRSGDSKYLATGFCGHNNFLGTLMVTVISILTCKFLSDKINYKFILLLILYYVTLINAQSSGPLLAYIITIIFLAVFLKIKNRLFLKNLMVLIIILIITHVSIQFINNQVRKVERCEFCTETVKKSINTGGTGRIQIWKNSLDIVKDNFIVGVGFDNFYLLYHNPKMDGGKKLVVEDNKVVEKKPITWTIVDNAHNVYLHTLVSTGILGLIPYLLLCLFVFIRGLKSNDKLILLLLAGFVAYSVQAFSNISVIQVAPIYYVMMGLILVSERNIKKVKKK